MKNIYITYQTLKKTENKIALLSFLTHTHLFCFTDFLHHSSVFDSFSFSRRIWGPRKSFPVHNQVRSCTPVFLLLLSCAVPYLCGSFMSTGLLCGFCWALQLPPGRQLSPSLARTNRLISLKFPNHVHWGPQSTDTTPKWDIYISCGLALPSWIPTQSCCARIWYREFHEGLTFHPLSHSPRTQTVLHEKLGQKKVTYNTNHS